MKLSAVFDRVLWLCATVSSQVVHRGLDRRVPRGRHTVRMVKLSQVVNR